MKGIKKELTTLPGIGMQKAAVLVRAGVRNWDILTAKSVEELTAYKGIGPALAEKIHSHLHPAPLLAPVEVTEPVVEAVEAAAPAQPAEPSAVQQGWARFWAASKELLALGREIFEEIAVAAGDRCLGVQPAPLSP